MPAVLDENDVVNRVLDGARISQDDARVLYKLPLQELGALADYRRQVAKGDAYDGRGGEIVTYIVDRNINYTNVCNVYCKFCAFYRTEKDDDHYVLSLEQIDQKLDELAGARRRADSHARRASSEARHRLVSRAALRTSARSIRTSTSTASARRSSTISRKSSECRCAK